MLPHPPLVIDLDGTLLRSDLLLETGLEFLRDQPQRCLQPLAWLARAVYWNSRCPASLP